MSFQFDNAGKLFLYTFAKFSANTCHTDGICLSFGPNNFSECIVCFLLINSLSNLPFLTASIIFSTSSSVNLVIFNSFLNLVNSSLFNFFNFLFSSALCNTLPLLHIISIFIQSILEVVSILYNMGQIKLGDRLFFTIFFTLS